MGIYKILKNGKIFTGFFILTVSVIALNSYLYYTSHFWSLENEKIISLISSFPPIGRIIQFFSEKADMTVQFWLFSFLAMLIDLFAILCILWFFVLKKDFFLKHKMVIFFIFVLGTSITTFFESPFGCASTSFFSEGLWLSQNNFDYAEFRNQPRWGSGGPLTYFISLYSFLIGVGFSTIKNLKALFFVHHSLSIISAAFCLTLSYKILRELIDDFSSLLGVLLVFTLPFVREEVRELNADIYLMCLMLLGFRSLLKRKYLQSVIWGILLVATKPVGVILAVVLCLVAGVRILTERRIKFEYVAMAFPMVLQMIILYSMEKGLGSGVVTNRAKDEMRMIVNLYTILFGKHFIMISCWVVTGYLIIDLTRKHARALLLNWREFIKNYKLSSLELANIILIVWLGLFVTSVRYGSSYRYLVMVSPLLIFNLLYFFKIKAKPKVTNSILSVFIFCSIFSIGFPQSKLLNASFYIYLQEDLGKFIENKFPNYTILTGRPLVQALAIPEFGFVKNKTRVISMARTRVASLAQSPVEGKIEEWPDDLLIAYGNNLLMPDKYIFNPETDKLVKKFRLQEVEIILYKRPKEFL